MSLDSSLLLDVPSKALGGTIFHDDEVVVEDVLGRKAGIHAAAGLVVMAIATRRTIALQAILLLLLCCMVFSNWVSSIYIDILCGENEDKQVVVLLFSPKPPRDERKKKKIEPEIFGVSSPT